MAWDRVRILLPAVVAAGVLEWVAVATESPWERATGLLWAALVAGPAFLLVLHPDLCRELGRLARWGAAWLPLAAVAGVGREAARLVLVARPAPGAPASADGVVVLYLGLLVLVVAAAIVALRRSPPPVRGLAWRLAPLALLLAFLPRGEDPLLASVFVVQALAALHLLGFRRSARAWTRATLVGGASFALGLAALVAWRGALLPRARLALDGDAGVAVLAPLVVACALLAVATLAFSRAPAAAPAPH